MGVGRNKNVIEKVGEKEVQGLFESLGLSLKLLSSHLSYFLYILDLVDKQKSIFLFLSQVDHFKFFKKNKNKK